MVLDPAEPVPVTLPGGAAAFFALVGELETNPGVPADPEGFPRLVGWMDPCFGGTGVPGTLGVACWLDTAIVEVALPKGLLVRTIEGGSADGTGPAS
jgi:hypothetical protein